MSGKVAAFVKMVSTIAGTIALNSGFQLYIPHDTENFYLLLAVMVISSAVACYHAIIHYRDVVNYHRALRQARHEVLTAIIGAPSYRGSPESEQPASDRLPTQPEG